jgi:hypothetical protein
MLGIKSVLVVAVLAASVASAAVVGGVDAAALTNDLNLQTEGNVGQDVSYVAFCVDGEEVDYDTVSNTIGYVFVMTVDGVDYTIDFEVMGDTVTYTSDPAIDDVVLKSALNQYLFDGATSDTVNTAGTPVANPQPNPSPCGDGQVGVKYNVDDGTFEVDDGNGPNGNGPNGPPGLF